MSNPDSILTFHHVLPWKDDLTIPPELLETLILFLKDHYNIISYQTFIEYLFDNRRLPKRSVLLTFDDGYLDNHLYAYPVLARHKVPAVIFAVTGQIRESIDCYVSLTFIFLLLNLNYILSLPLKKTLDLYNPSPFPMAQYSSGISY